jgi:tetratricopeptide (TPR) repeat protein
MTEIAGALWCAGKLADAEKELRLVLERSKATLGPDSEMGIHAEHSLGGVLREQKRLDEAEAAYRDALDRAQRTMGPEDALTLGILTDLSSVVADRDPGKAIPLSRDLLPRLRSSVGEDHPLYVVALSNLANDLSVASDEVEAIRVAEDALPRSLRILGDIAENTINLRTTLTGAYFAQKRDAEAEKTAIVLVETAVRARGEEDVRALYGKSVLGSVYMRQQRYADAERVRTELLAVERRTLGETSSGVFELMYGLACTTALEGKRAEAIDWLRQSVSHGYRDADWMTKDSDLLSLHGDPRFEAVVAEARKLAPPAAAAK